MKKLTIAGLLLSLLCADCVFNVQGQVLLNIDFGAGSASSETGAAATGNSPTDVWNFYTRDNGVGGWKISGALTNLQVADGSATTMGLVVTNAPGAWANGSSDSMFNEYIYPLDGGNATVAVTNLPAGTYDFYIYGQDAQYQLAVDGADFGTRATTNAPIVNPPIWQEGVQFVLFSSISIAAGQSPCITVMPGRAGWAVISGLQIASGTGWAPPNTNPPVLTQQPASQTVYAGSNVVFSGSATGSPPLFYAWLFNGSAIPGATGKSLFLNAVQTNQAGDYSLVVSNAFGSATTSNAVLTVVRLNHPPLAQSQSVSVPYNGSTALTLIATDSENDPLTYSVVSSPQHGSLTGTAPDLTYAATTDYSGPDSFSFKVNDGATDSAPATISISVLPPSRSDVQLINVDLGAGSATTKTGPAATGISTADYWNFFTRDDGQGGWKTSGTLANLQTASGAATAVGFTILDAPGAWGNGSSDPMFNDYLYPLDGGNATVAITNLPPGSYDLFVYGQDATYQLDVGGTNFGTLATTNAPIVNPVVWQEGVEYVVFRRINISAGQSATLTIGPGVAGYAVISGFQIQSDILVDVDLGAGTNTTEVGAAAFGQSSSDFWNFYTRDDGQGGWKTSGALTNLKLANGTTSGIGFSISNAPGAWGNGSSDPMFNDYLYPLGGDNATVTVTNLPTGSYDFYIYGQDARYQLTSGSVDLGTRATTNAPIVNPPVWKEGVQFVLFRGVNIAAGQSASVTVMPGVAGYAVIAGFQITSAAGPSTATTNQGSAPVLVQQPVSQTAYAGSNVVFSGSATGAPPLFYAWLFNGTRVSGATNTPLTLHNVQTNQGGNYSLFVSNAYGSVTSSNAVLTVLRPNHAPVAQSQSVSVPYNGSTALTLTATDSDNDSLTYSIVSAPQHGSLTGTAPNVTYTAAANYSGPDNFSFKANDGLTDSAPATVSITVLPQNQTGVQLVNVDLGAGASTTEVGPAAFGQTPSDFWNFYTRDDGNGGWKTSGALTNLQLADGTTSAIGFSISNAPGAWGNGSSDPMFNDYLYPLGGGNATVTVTNLPTGSYDFYIYGQDARYQLTAGGGDLGTRATTNAPIVNPPVWKEGAQFVLFRGVNIAAGQSASVTVMPGVAGYAVIAGFQIASGAQSSPPATNPPALTLQPVSQTAYAGSNVVFSGSATGSPPLFYAWLFNGTRISGATNTSLALQSVQTNQTGSYSLFVSNAYGSVTSSNAVLTVLRPNHAPVAQSQSVSVPYNGSTALTLTATDSDNDSLTYSIVSAPQHGSLTGTAPNVTYTAAANYSGPDNFSFKANDGLTDSAPATVSINVIGEVQPGHNLINVDFGGGGSTPGIDSKKTGLAANGHTTNDVWNFYSRDDGQGGWMTYGTLTNLVTAEGAVTSSGLIVNDGPGAWGNGSSDPMYDDYIYPLDGSNLLVSITNISAGSYDVYTYGLDASYEVLVNGASLGTKPLPNGPFVNPVVWQENQQYALFHSTALPEGSAIVVVVHPGVGGYAALSGLQISQVVDSAPVAIDVSAGAWQDVPLSMPASKLVSVSQNANVGPVTLSGLSNTSTNGGAVALNKGMIKYTPPRAYVGSDRFEFAITDAHGVSSSASVIIDVRSTNQASGNLMPPVHAGGRCEIHLTGIPGRTYSVQRATGIAGPWTTIGALNMPDSGVTGFTDMNPPQGSAFYRTALQ